MERRNGNGQQKTTAKGHHTNIRGWLKIYIFAALVDLTVNNGSIIIIIIIII